MKRIITIAVAAAIAFASVLAEAAQITVGVQGMVCSFCAQGIEKKFKADPAVATVKVDLKKKVVLLTTREGQTLDEATIRKNIMDSGFNVTSVEYK